MKHEVDQNLSGFLKANVKMLVLFKGSYLRVLGRGGAEIKKYN